ncbi:MAG: S9 family peptidase, partial [Pseudomonadota bacterium]
PRLPGSVLIGMNDRDSSLFDLHRIDLGTGARTLVAENPGFNDWAVDLNLLPQAAMRARPGGGSEVLRREADGTWTPVATIPAEDTLTTGLLSMTDDRTVLMLDSRGRDLTALTALDLDSGALTTLGEHPQADVNDVLLHPVSRRPVAFGAEYLEQDWRALDPEFAPHLDKLTGALGGSLQFVASTHDFKQLLVYSDQAQVPGAYFRYNLEQGELEPLFTTRPELEGQPLQPTEPVTIEARDGLRLVSYLTRPAQQGGATDPGPAPLVLLVHGGPWARDSGGFSAMRQWLANRGYAVLNVNYRGSTGFGKAFLNAAIREFSGAMHEDLIDAVSWAVAEGIADPDRVAIMGGSYGGYATLVGVTFTPDAFACGVDLVGPSSLVTLVESFPDYWAPLLENSWFKFVGDPAEEADRADMLNRSPITRVAAITVPLLIGQGENDPRVTKLESDQLVAAMQARELPVTYLNYPDEGHGFVRPENRLSFWATAEGFLAQCLGGRAEPIGDSYAGSSVQVLAGAEQIPGLPELLSELAAETR